MYSKTGDYVWNTPRASHDADYEDKKYTHDDGDGRGKYQRTAIDSPNPRPNLKYVWKGYPPPDKGWRYSRATMDELDADGRIYKPADKTRRPRLKRYWDENEGRVVDDLWLDVAPVNSQATDRVGYPTQKPMALLERIISASSNEGDLVLDCFSGSGTTAVAARALGRRWVAVDSGKLALYTTQRRLLGGEGGAASVEICHAGLYDNQLLEALSYVAFTTFTLDLFGCRAEPFKVGGVPMSGRRKGDPVHVFPFGDTTGDLDEGYVASLHARVGSKIGRTAYVIVPESRCDAGLFEDMLRHGKTTYFILRVPYSVIEALHDRAFQSIGQPAALSHVNDAIDAYGFDFIEPPEVGISLASAGSSLRVTVDHFYRGGLDPDDVEQLDDQGRGDLAMVLVDTGYDGESFVLAEHVFGETLRASGWQFTIEPTSGQSVMLIFIDIFGNELRRSVKAPAKRSAKASPKAKVKRAVKA